MTIKIEHIEPGSEADKALKVMLERQKAFREAMQSGKVEEYAQKQKFAQPIPVPKP